MTEEVTFVNLGVEECLQHALSRQGITTPFEVQREAIPEGMLGRDVCCRAPTGSGKTLAFGLPLVQNCKRAESRYPTALILTPTRELAEQICTVLAPLAHEVDREVLAIYGGTSYTRQKKALNRGTDIVVACPGRLLDLIEQGAMFLDDVAMVVLDEADRMADMGFMEPVQDILRGCSNERQTILFSATLDDDVAELVRDFQSDPAKIEVGPKEVSMGSMHHRFWMMHSSNKAGYAADAIKQCGRSIVFCRTRMGVDRVGDELSEEGVSVATLHGGLNQRQRDRAMQRFSNGSCMALIATDVAARGIDVEGVKTVIHYDPADNGKAYKHRSGRTARAGQEGIVISLVQKPQKRSVMRIQQTAGIRCDFTQPDLNELPDTGFNYNEFTDSSRNSEARSNRQSNGQRNGRRNERKGGQNGSKQFDGRRHGGKDDNSRNFGGRRGGGKQGGQHHQGGKNRGKQFNGSKNGGNRFSGGHKNGSSSQHDGRQSEDGSRDNNSGHYGKRNDSSRSNGGNYSNGSSNGHKNGGGRGKNGDKGQNFGDRRAKNHQNSRYGNKNGGSRGGNRDGGNRHGGSNSRHKQRTHQ